MSSATETQVQSPAAEWRDYFALTKPRVMSLVVFTAFVGLAAAPVTLNPAIALIAILSIAVGAGASGALNMAYDADIDAVMARTRARPIPAGRVSVNEANALGLVLSALSVMTLGLATNALAAGLLAFTIFFYAVIYTRWLKRSTPQNIVIGGLAGALPPAIAWAAATGELSWAPVSLVVLIFTWTPPHFWALSLLTARDYERARVPMLPVTHGPAITRTHILVYSLILWPVGFLPLLTGIGGVLYAICALVGGAGMAALAAKLWWVGRTQSADDDGADDAGASATAARTSKQLFAASIVYLFGLFAAILFETAVGAATLKGLM